MRTLVAMISGCLLTVAAAYVHDSMGASTLAGGTKTDTSNMIVNWDVAGRKWDEIREIAHGAWPKLQS